MNKLRALPSYLLCRLILLFAWHHPWHAENFSLQDWFDRQTPDCVLFDYVFWICGLSPLVWIIFELKSKGLI